MLNKNYEFTDEIYDTLQNLDQQTFKHCLRVSQICEIVEEELGLDNRLSMAAKVHDIGKIYFSSDINNKLTAFSTVEKQLMKLHPFLGYSLLNDYGVPADINSIVLLHHGENPPIIGNINPYIDSDIKLYANILHNADTFEALTSIRPYRRNFSISEAINILQKEKYAYKPFIELIESEKLILPN